MATACEETTIWGAGTTRTFRPIWTAEELGVRYNHRPIGPRTGETTTDEYTRLNRKQKIPFLKDASLDLSESVAICRYLVGKHAAGTGFYVPDSPETRAREDEWICYTYGELDETSLYVIRRHEDLKAIYGEAPTAVDSAKAYVARHFAVIEKHLDSNAYLVGGQFGLADIVLISCLDWAVSYRIEMPAALHEYRERIRRRPAYQRAFKTNYQSTKR